MKILKGYEIKLEKEFLIGDSSKVYRVLSRSDCKWFAMKMFKN